ncbi:hypothetical protein [Halorientalis halophila]|uniref:hypothetical protein n=1 Tax=Halorientalis halophila TaxID=3108499 RepID=UPI0030087296
MTGILPVQPVPTTWIALHAAPAAPRQPVPHWIVLLVSVPTFMLLTGGAVLAIDRLLERLEEANGRNRNR